MNLQRFLCNLKAISESFVSQPFVNNLKYLLIMKRRLWLVDVSSHPIKTGVAQSMWVNVNMVSYREVSFIFFIVFAGSYLYQDYWQGLDTTLLLKNDIYLISISCHSLNLVRKLKHSILSYNFVTIMVTWTCT